MNKQTKILTMTLAVVSTLAGCASKSIDVKHPNIVDMSSPLPVSAFEAPYDPELGRIRLALAQVSCAVPIAGQKSSFEEVARSQMTELLGRCRNFSVANRAVTAETKAEWALVAGNAANPATVPDSPGITIPQYMLKVTITQVERDIVGSGDEKQWNLYISSRSGEQRRDGAIAMMVEVIDIATMDTVFDLSPQI